MTRASVDDVRRAFAREQIHLSDAEEDFWGATLVASAEGVSLQVQVFVDPAGARTVADSLESLLSAVTQMPRLGELRKSRPEHGRIERRANVLVVVPPRSTTALDQRLARALAHLPRG